MRELTRDRRAGESSEQRAARLQQVRDHLADESAEQREARLQQMREQMRDGLADESAEQREAYERVATTPGRPLGEGRSGIDFFRMRGFFRILYSKFYRKLNYPRRARTPCGQRLTYTVLIIRSVYREYTITRFLG